MCSFIAVISNRGDDKDLEEMIRISAQPVTKAHIIADHVAFAGCSDGTPLL